MFRLPEIRRLFRLAFPRPDAAPGDVDAEFEFHLAMRIDELKALGLSEPEARAEALRRFGDVGTARVELTAADRAAARTAQRSGWLADFWRDLRYAGRELRRNWSFAMVAVGVLGLGIGLTTTMVSLFDRLALHPLPYPDADRLAALWLVTGTAEHSMRVTPNRAMRETMVRMSGVERTDAYLSNQAMVDLDGTPEVAPTRLVSVGLLERLGARVAIGRSFMAEDTTAGPLTTVLSYTAWRNRFGGRPDVLGQTLRIEGRIATIVGVLQPDFDLTAIDGNARADFWLPLRTDLLGVAASSGDGVRSQAPDPAQDRSEILVTIARGSRMSTVAAALDHQFRSGAQNGLFKDFHVALAGAEDLVGKSLRKTMSLLLAAVGLVLLVACANIAALLLGQAAGRAQEFGVRAALGAGRARVVRQLLAESALLGSLGAAGGIGVTVLMLALVRRLRPERLLTIDDVRINGLTFLIAGAVALAATVTFGLAPIWAVARTDTAAALVGRARRSFDSRGARRLRSGLVVGQIALTLILLVGAGLLVKSFVRERNLPLGLDIAGLAQIAVTLPEREFPIPARREQVMHDLVARVRRIPGVRDAALAVSGPLDFGAMMAEFLPEGKPWPAVEAPGILPMHSVSSDYFAVTGLHLVAGTTFGTDTTAQEVVLDEATARRVWGTVKVVGQRVRFGRGPKDAGSTIVGVASTVRTSNDGFGDRAPTLYVRMDRGGTDATLVVRAPGEAALRAVSRAIRDTDPGIRIRSATTVKDAMIESTAGHRFTMAIIAFFSTLSLGLAMVGLYGVIAFAVRQRHFEFGVRLAIGALPARVRGMVLRDGIARIVAGNVIGLIGSAGAVRLIRGMLYQMSPWDPWIFAGAAALIAVVGVAAVWIPAESASRVDPLVAIRAE